MRMVSLPIALLCLLTSAAAASADRSPAGVKTFGRWTATCNNLGACVAMGTVEADVFFYVRIARDAGATAAPAIKFVVVAQDPPKGAVASFTLKTTTAGKTVSLGPFPAKIDTDDTSVIAAALSAGEASLAVVDAIRNADRLDYAVAGLQGTLDLKGLSATLRWIDAQQGRAGTPTALVAKGMTPIGQVAEPRQPPLIVAAAAGSVTEITKPTVSQAILDKAASLPDCVEDTVKAHENVEAWRVGADLILVSVPCDNAAYNSLSALYFTDAKGASVRPVLLPQPAGEPSLAGNILFNMSFDSATMSLSDFAKGRGIGDCGETRQWLWTGTTFALFEATRLDACPGAMSDDWPNLYSAKRK